LTVVSYVVQFILCALRMPSFANTGVVYIYGFGNGKACAAV